MVSSKSYSYNVPKSIYFFSRLSFEATLVPTFFFFFKNLPIACKRSKGRNINEKSLLALDQTFPTQLDSTQLDLARLSATHRDSA